MPINTLIVYNPLVTIEDKIRQSSEFKNLLETFNTPVKHQKGVTITASNTTLDVQNMILEILSNLTSQGIIYTTYLNKNILKYLYSTQILSNLNYNNLKSLLDENNFTHQNKVNEKGEYAILGDIITFWPSFYEHPIRISFFGDKTESIYLIDEFYNRNIQELKYIVISDENILEDNSERQSLHINLPEKYTSDIKIAFSNTNFLKPKINFGFSYPSLFYKRFDVLEKLISARLKDNWLVKIFTKHRNDLPKSLRNLIIDQEFKSGFENSKLKLAVYTDRELFATLFIFQEKIRSKKTVNKYLAQLEGEVEIDDYIVHEDYGIAVYRGIQQREIMGKKIDYLVLEYDQSDKLSVPIHQVYKLTKYIGPRNIKPKITRLGKTDWKRIKTKVKENAYFLARELLRHYAKGEIIRSDRLHSHEWEDKFSSEFEFDLTEDQKKATYEILADLESKKPMNRLLVGDVGFGKTEVAIRAAFRATLNDKQVAVLCPTTILVSQHYSVFKHRMRDYPFNIKALSRFGTKSENNKTINDLENGKVDIVIGTHRLLSKDINFKDLGLLIIDEEQKFGVKQKERIKQLAYKSHVLSMSATPIPRTLSMSLSNLKDISLITTPPPGRRSIKTKVEYFTWKKAVKVIKREIKRRGQVYFLHNEVRTIESIKRKLNELLPNIQFECAHGQMHPAKLDKIMRSFYNKEIDCLICSTIIENGIDIKNVNTIIINKSQNFGLSQLYQLRGRVGRGEKQAYCYLFYNRDLKIKKKGKVYFKKAKERLDALQESQELGSGFKIANRDLEIRGAGNLLGKKQHGSISAIGLGLYTQLLANEIDKLKKAEKK